MDAPGETYEEEADSHHQHLHFPQLSRSQSTLSVARASTLGLPQIYNNSSPDLTSSFARPTSIAQKRKSVRIRPGEALEQQYAALPSPLKEVHPSPPASLPSRASKMSLFNLFSKPKVEKLKAYTEPGLQPPPRAISTSHAGQKKSERDLRSPVKDAPTGKYRPTSSKSAYSARASRIIMSKEQPPPLPDDKKLRLFEPPPLFQVWPQAIKHGTFEATMLAPEVLLQRQKTRTGGSTLFLAGTDSQTPRNTANRGSIDPRVVARPTTRHANGSSLGANLTTKLFVLVTSGYLLQYAERGSSDRLPEKVLQLDTDSAAYASDLIAGKHHVLQVAHAVDPSGAVVASPHSFLSKLGLRSQAARRMTTNFLIVMPGVQEMGEWMAAIRQEIERQGGKRARSDSATERKTNDPAQLDLKKTPSLSHRYMIKREKTISKISSPVTSSVAGLGPISPTDADILSTQEVPEKASVMEQEPLSSDHVYTTRPRSSSDSASNHSSTAASVDQQQLDKLRYSDRSIPTTSRTNSTSSSPPSEPPKETVEPRPGSISFLRSPYRSLSSYSLAKRRSAVPLMLQGKPLSGEANQTGAVKNDTVPESSMDSPVLGERPATSDSSKAFNMRLLAARSVPNLRVCAIPKSGPELPTSPVTDKEQRPESFVGDLPDPSRWSSKIAPAQKAMHSEFEINDMRITPRTTVLAQGRPLRAGSQSFSLPIRINPQEPSLQRPVPKRASYSADADIEALSPIGSASTWTTKVDFNSAAPAPISTSRNSWRQSYSTGASLPTRTPPLRLSLFPTSLPPSTSPGTRAIQRSPSVTGLHPAPPTQTNNPLLKRPASLQVRTDHAPFLSSTRPASSLSAGPHTRPNAAPLRSLRPSRSLAAMQSIDPRNMSEPEQFLANSRRLTDLEEATDRPTPLPVHIDLLLRESSRPSSRARKNRTSVVIPEVVLGPPAPPPQAPLPEIPSHLQSSGEAPVLSRPASRQASISPIVGSGTPIGVAVGEILVESESRQSMAGGSTVGLGIEVS